MRSTFIFSVAHLLTPITRVGGVSSRIRLIVAQILGAYIACLLIYVQYHDFIKVRATGYPSWCHHITYTCLLVPAGDRRAGSQGAL